MKRLLSFVTLLVFITSCNSGQDTARQEDSATTQKPTAIQDTGAQHPTGITTGSVISTDTSKFDVKPVNKDSVLKK